jgi:hypothetical protein
MDRYSVTLPDAERLKVLCEGRNVASEFSIRKTACAPFFAFPYDGRPVRIVPETRRSYVQAAVHAPLRPLGAAAEIENRIVRLVKTDVEELKDGFSECGNIIDGPAVHAVEAGVPGKVEEPRELCSLAGGIVREPGDHDQLTEYASPPVPLRTLRVSTEQAGPKSICSARV